MVCDSSGNHTLNEPNSAPRLLRKHIPRPQIPKNVFDDTIVSCKGTKYCSVTEYHYARFYARLEKLAVFLHPIPIDFRARNIGTTSLESHRR